ncbi:MAG: hypothetical protein M1165_00580 [Candidatus Pacearchaeota archaeon]|nr:hypothetical protein [Candidatus Pacearchaeota archaeon]MDE1848758.1 hypothetical protein [Nanoarchaeota archaeon]
MARKRGRRVSKSRSRVRNSRSSRMMNQSSPVSMERKNIRIIFSNLVLFVLMFLISLILYRVLPIGIFQNLFAILMMGFGFISVAFLITLLVFLFIRLFRKERAMMNRQKAKPRRSRRRRR